MKFSEKVKLKGFPLLSRKSFPNSQKNYSFNTSRCIFFAKECTLLRKKNLVTLKVNSNRNRKRKTLSQKFFTEKKKPLVVVLKDTIQVLTKLLSFLFLNFKVDGWTVKELS